MPETQNHGNADFSKFDTMTDDELEKILRLDAQNTACEATDTDMLLYIMQVLADRRKNQQKPAKSSEEAFQSFRENYFPLDHEENTVEADSPAIVPCKVRAKKRRWSRRSVVAAALIPVVLLTSVMIYSFRFNIRERLAKWSKNIFYFDSEMEDEAYNPTNPTKSTQQLFEPLHKALRMCDISTDVIPTWIPEEYEFKSVNVTETATGSTVMASYANDQRQVITIQVGTCDENSTQYIQKGDEYFEVYQSKGNEYYIFDNSELYVAAWTDQDYESYIAGELPLEQIHAILDSIGEG